jgi:hypothetical protein
MATPGSTNVLARLLTRLWTGSAPLTVTGLLMIPALAIAVVGLLVDPRTITGAPAWLKPAKFAVSITIYTLTLAWIFSLIPNWVRTRRIVEWTTAIVMVLEVVIIDLQAFRGTTSHFNVGTVLDGVLFTTMGAAIVTQTLSTIAVAVALWRERLPDAALGWALRLGMIITIVGAMTGGLMTRPTDAQLTAARAGERMLIAGAHTVGAPDGGPGLPGTGWSTEHGDLRVAHFVGLHALQVLPVIALLLRRTRVNTLARVRLTVMAAVSYAALYVILLTQALRGQSVLMPDARTLMVLGLWAAGTALIAAAVGFRRQPMQRTVVV